MEASWNQIKQWIGENHKSIAVTVGGIVVTWKVVSIITEKVDDYRTQQALKKWENGPKDVVIIHTLPRGKTIPNLSPFGMKLETYLRIAKIPYEMDYEVPWGKLGKTPWVTLNGEHLVDTELIIKFLNKKYNVKISDHSEEQRALAKLVRIVMDEYLYWAMGLWRYVHSEGKGLDQIFDLSPFALKMFYKVVNKRVQENAWAQGTGRHSKEQVIEMMKEALQSVSIILGDKPFLLGDQPCEEDCTLFGMLGMFRWAAPGSPYEAYMNEEVTNLKNYCDRMKSLYWSDWEENLAPSIQSRSLAPST